MDDNRVPDIKEIENAIKSFYRTGYKALRMGRKYFVGLILSIIIDIVVGLAAFIATVNVAIKYHKASEEVLIEATLNAVLPYLVTITIVNLIVSLILYLFIRRTIEMYERHYRSWNLMADMLNKIDCPLGIPFILNPSRYYYISKYFIIFIIIDIITAYPALKYIIYMMSLYYDPFHGLGIIFALLKFVSDFIIMILIVRFFSSLNEYFHLEKASTLINVYIIMFILDLIQTFINNIIVSFLGVVVLIIYLVYLHQMLNEYERNLEKSYIKLNNSLKKLEECIKIE